jgi:hypothetical protein
MDLARILSPLDDPLEDYGEVNGPAEAVTRYHPSHGRFYSTFSRLWSAGSRAKRPSLLPKWTSRREFAPLRVCRRNGMRLRMKYRQR